MTIKLNKHTNVKDFNYLTRLKGNIIVHIKTTGQNFKDSLIKKSGQLKFKLYKNLVINLFY